MRYPGAPLKDDIGKCPSCQTWQRKWLGKMGCTSPDNPGIAVKRCDGTCPYWSPKVAYLVASPIFCVIYEKKT